MLKIYNHYISRFAALLVCMELLLLIAMFYLGINIRFMDWNESSSISFLSLLPQAITFVFVMISSMALMGMYQLDSQLDFKAILFRLMPSMVLGFGLMTLIFYLIPEIYLGRGVLIIIMFLSLFGVLLVRSLLFKWPSMGMLQHRILVLGIGGSANELINQTKNMDYRKSKIVGFVPFYDEERCVPDSVVLPKKDSLMALINQYSVAEIIIATQERRGGNFPIQELLECKMHGIKVTDIAAFFEREQGHIRMDSFHPSWLIYGGGFDQSLLRSSIKRIFDLVASGILLIATLPIMLVTIFCILIEDGFPIFYRQERVGKGGRTFMILKFRSMSKNAEKDKDPQWAMADDPRVTWVGRVIRKLRIDELPQIVNVLENDMSFVGPRPERPYFVDILCTKVPYYNIRHSIKPGITGWAQVRYPYGASVEDTIEKLQYDLYYVKNHSLFLDVIILIHTVEVVILGKGGR
ncbi:sugar transferase, PEP-CTERM system associated/exopolysaccharide biosynthesis polyprenyl glycosylphosphotransferase [Nitrosomonas cryotolerans]|uniref:Sugar transferase, PEP-CTERM system associated/exopolysaccharide biosynthesis polyprenyl glycosylphosphotransferase n=2 Tax=Nitrosomonas cryotolerans TaxID=44575 RepID=A0A1N6JBA2_9PROT|nr:sugar transferase, PEP-CTERM system associated/exopolysaccharide biosynthesis polyprenyl glycosylphosphotransferase [Nitrosomonas cryotolerans]SIO41513.1 sugar transferase, PEP-CTERM system associated/exopolysaccharide biosynthesis polyprenyl glycosylphosphotransferase [Nitrosomonas cryotolerans ATCC 49181]